MIGVVFEKGVEEAVNAINFVPLKLEKRLIWSQRLHDALDVLPVQSPQPLD